MLIDGATCSKYELKETLKLYISDQGREFSVYPYVLFDLSY